MQLPAVLKHNGYKAHMDTTCTLILLSSEHTFINLTYTCSMMDTRPTVQVNSYHLWQSHCKNNLTDLIHWQTSEHHSLKELLQMHLKELPCNASEWFLHRCSHEGWFSVCGGCKMNWAAASQVYLMQLVFHRKINHHLSSYSATMVTTLWLKEPIYFCSDACNVSNIQCCLPFICYEHALKYPWNTFWKARLLRTLLSF